MNHRPQLLPAPRGRSGAGCDGVASRVGWVKLILVAYLLLSVPGQAPVHSQVPAPDLYTAEHEQTPQVDQYYTEKFRATAREQQEQFRKRIAIPDAVTEDISTQATLEAVPELQSTPHSEASYSWRRGLLWAGVFVLSGILLVLRLFPDAVENLKGRLAPWDALRSDVEVGTANVRVESQAVAEFIAAFRTGPVPRPESAAALAPLEQFHTNWPRLLAELRNHLQPVIETTDAQVRRRYLNDLGRELRSLKGETGLPELLPVWQMVCALEGLIRQLSAKVNEVTPSTLRTVGGGLDFLAELCQPGLDAQLLTRRPVRLLAVAEDSISRHALSFALECALHAPDLAASGETGLALTREHTYDVIFLDVEMSEMDSAELCAAFHKTTPNRTTPVVFVTRPSDFEAWRQSARSGGGEVIAKPFLTFELAVKALTLVLQSRLQPGRGPEAILPSSSTPFAATLATPTDDQALIPALNPAPVDDDKCVPGYPLLVEAETVAEPPLTSLEELAPAVSTRDAEEIATEFLTRAPEHLGWVNEHLQSALQITDESAWLPMLSDVYLRLNSFTPDERFARGHPALQLSSALEKLLRKLLQSPKAPAKATLFTVTSAVELLQELCTTAVAPGNAAAPVQLLVVDDDPAARRTMVGALQTMFAKPSDAENGDAALARAAERTFDVIFLDLHMPGMDGFEIFARLRSEGRNTETPIVFVCSRSDLGPTAEINVRGDCDIVAKPFLPAELLVKTLTLMLRRQQEKRGSFACVEPVGFAGACA
jgi:CheY-like chemotaxis protein